MTVFAQAFNAALLHFVWQGALGALGLQIALLFLRKGSASSRYVASCVALAALAAAPVITTAALYQRTPSATPSRAVGELLLSAASASALPTFSWLSTLRAWALPAWSIGVLLFALRLVWGCRQVSLLRKSGEPANDELRAIVGQLAARMGLQRQVEVMISTIADVPSVIGWLRPVILLPTASLMGLTPDQLSSILAHELAHVRRYDYAVNMLQAAAETLLFYHPAVWWISARIRDERELCCDDLAVACCQDAVGYARALTELEKLRGARPAMAMGATGGSLLNRVERLLGTPREDSGASKAASMIALLIGVACLSLNVGWVRAQTSSSEVVHRMRAEYPEGAMAKHITGTVVLEVTLDANSAVSDARVLSGPQELRRAALESVLHWEFVPSAASGVRNVSIDFEPPTTKTYMMDGKAHSMRVRDDGDPEAERQLLIDQLKAAEELAKAGEDRLQQIEELRNLLDELKHQQKASHGIVSGMVDLIDDSIIGRIDFYGVPNEIREQIARSMPRLGEKLTHERREAITEAIGRLSGPVEIHYYQMEGGLTALIVSMPTARTTEHFRIDRKF